MRAYFPVMVSISIHMSKSCYCVTLPCTTVSLSKDECLIQAWTINLGPEIFGLRLGVRTTSLWGPGLESRWLYRLNVLASCNSSINSDWLFNILVIASNCKVQSLRVAATMCALIWANEHRRPVYKSDSEVYSI